MPNQPAVLHSFCIYGAGIVAASVYTAIKTLYNRTPLFFLISDAGGRGGMLDASPAQIDGIAVKELSAWRQELQALQKQQPLYDPDQNTVVPAYYLIAVPEAHHQAVVKSLYSLDLLDPPMEDSRIILFTSELENELMEAYYSSLAHCLTAAELLDAAKRPITQAAHQEKDVLLKVFQAKSHMDKPLREQPSLPAAQGSRLPRYITPIQAGAALTAASIAPLKDNTGESISVKNRNYCELTATYHAWKNCHAAYKGICHYRRIFAIDDAQMRTLLTMKHKWDVILPYPSVYYPNIDKEHTRYVGESDWRAMLQALRETAPAYLEAYEKGIADGEQYFHNFNMLIARAEVFDEYCDFLFKVLERTEELTTPKGAERADRFAGYLGENLTTLFFLKNRENLRILYAGKLWLT